ncbi:glycine zipper 2TM domain-containing protein [Burkholderia sp. 4701]|nr:glycine zipper 2TM domain-containing protein [Burkholderia sp. 4701]MXN85382.1 glycine zipper 2TM domain-containing protein [Burkholderia sp. 4812]
MTSKNILFSSVVLLINATLSGCALDPASPDVYSPSQAMREQTVRMGVIEEVRTVKIDEGESGLGVLGGGAAGAVAGSKFGKGRGALLAAIAGGLVGALAGHEADQAYNTSHGLELTVRLDNGDIRAITQAGTGEVFKAGDRVRLLSSGGKTRVTH